MPYYVVSLTGNKIRNTDDYFETFWNHPCRFYSYTFEISKIIDIVFI